MIIQIDNVKYTVRNNFLHRGNNPRLVLSIRENGGFVFIQFDNNQRVVTDIHGDKKFWADSYQGYWCNKEGYREVEIKLIEV